MKTLPCVRGKNRRFSGIGLIKVYLIGSIVLVFENRQKVLYHSTLPVLCSMFSFLCVYKIYYICYRVPGLGWMGWLGQQPGTNQVANPRSRDGPHNCRNKFQYYKCQNSTSHGHSFFKLFQFFSNHTSLIVMIFTELQLSNYLKRPTLELFGFVKAPVLGF